MKKLASILLSLVMMLSVVIVPTVAEATSKVPTLNEGKAAIQQYWYSAFGGWIGYDPNDGTINDANREVAKSYPLVTSVDLATTEESNFQVATLADLVAIRTAVNGGNSLLNKNFYMTADIDLSSIANWTPIGYKASSSYAFAGSFHGMGYTISNLTINVAGLGIDGLTTAGLFGSTESGTISWIVLSNPKVTGFVDEDPALAGFEYGTGAIVGVANNTVQSCLVVGDEASYVKGSANVGGVVGHTGSFIKCSENDGVAVSTVGEYANVGGIVGRGGWMERCLNNATVRGGIRYAGGISGYGAAMIIKCINLGDISIVGDVHASVGGICGYTWDYTYNYNTNYGTVKATDAGATIGSIYGTARHSDSYNFGDNYSYLYNYGIACGYDGRLEGLVGKFTENGDNRAVDNYQPETCQDNSLGAMLDVKYQLSDDQTSIRFNVCLDDLMKYDKVIFTLTIGTYGYATAQVEVTNAFTSLYGAGEEYTPAAVCNTEYATAFATFTLTDIPEGTKLTATASVVEVGNDAPSYKGDTVVVTTAADTAEAPEKLVAEFDEGLRNLVLYDADANPFTVDALDATRDVTAGSLTVDLTYQAWPTVCRGDGDTLYAVCSLRVGHVDPFGATALYVSHDNGANWTGPTIINDTPVDDRDTGVVYLGNGKLLVSFFTIGADAFMEGGSYRNQMINQGFTAEQIAAKEAQWNEMLAQNPDDPLLKSNAWILLSDDYGQTWSDPIAAPATSPHGPTLTNDGTLIYVGGGPSGPEVHHSKDGGRTWTYIATIPVDLSDLNVNGARYLCSEPYGIQLSDGSFVAAVRVEDHSGTVEGVTLCTYLSYSKDGYNFSKAVRVDDMMGSTVHFLELSNGALVMSYQYRGSAFEELRESTTGIRARVSYDGGRTWDDVINITELPLDAPYGDYGYPATIELDDGSLMTVYYQPVYNSSTGKYSDDPAILYTQWKLVEPNT